MDAIQEFEVVLELCRPVILGECASACRRTHDPRIEDEDLLQDVYERLWQQRVYILTEARNRRAVVRKITRSAIARSLRSSDVLACADRVTLDAPA